MPRTLETVLIGRDLLSPVLVQTAGNLRGYDQSVTGSMTRTTAAVESGSRRQSAAMTQMSAAATQAAATLRTASANMVQAREREQVAASRVAAAEERLAALRASGTASGMRLALAEDNVAQATLRSQAAQQQRVIAAGRLAVADEALTTANGRLSASNTTVSTSTTRIVGASTEATVAMRAQQAAANGLASSNGFLGSSLSPLTAGLGAVALGLGYATFRGAAFDSAMSEVQASTQASAGTMADLRDMAIELGSATQFSAEDAARGITELAKAGVSTADILNGGLAGALDLAAAGQLEVGDAAEIAATALTIFGLRGDQVSHVADLLAAGAGKAQGSVQDMSAAMNQSALVAEQTGLSVEDTAGALALFASNGLTGSDAGTSFKTMLQSLNPSSEAAATLMDTLGLRAYDAQGQFVGLSTYAGQLQTALSGMSEEQANATLKTIFGSDAVRAAAVLYQAGSDGVSEWTRNVNDAGYAAQYAADLNDNLRGDLEKLGGAFDSAMTSIGDGTQGSLRWLVQSLTDVIDAGGDVIGFLGDLPPGFVAAGAAIAAYLLWGSALLAQLALLRVWMNANLLTPLVLGFANLLSGTVTLTGALTAARGALTAFLTTAAPFVAVAAISAGVVAILQADKAATDARESIAALMDPVANSTSNVERLQAQANALDELRGQAETTANALSEYENRSLFEKIWDWGSPDDPGDALEEAAFQSEHALREMEEQAARADQSIEVLGRQYGISRDKVIEFADAHGINLSGSLMIAQTEFARLAEANGMVQNSTSAATAAVGSYGDLLVQVGDQAGDSTERLKDWLDMIREANESFADPLGTYNDLLSQKEEAERASAQSTADSTEDSSDSWEDYAQDVSVSLSEYAAQLEQQIANQEAWRSNLAIIAQRGGLDVANALAQMGADGADLTAQMATATTDDFARMATGLTTQAQLAGAGASQALATELQVMSEVGRQGAAATAQSIATELGIGVDQVAAIAGQYGVTLASGINPILQALGNPVLRLRNVFGFGSANGNLVDYYANGGMSEQHVAQIAPAGSWRVWAEPETGGESYIPLAPAKRARSMDIWRETGKRLNAPEAAFFANGGFTSAGDVPPISSTAPFGVPLSTAANAAMTTERNAAIAFLNANAEPVASISGGPAGGNAIGGGWQTIAKIVQAAIPQARINSTYRPGDPGYHGRGKAVDFGFGSGPGGAGSAGLAKIAAFLYTGYGRTLAELIYDGIGDNTPDVKNGRDHTYNAGTRAEHRNHVHAAVYANGGLVEPGGIFNPHVRDSGGPLLPGYTYNGLNRPEIVLPMASGGLVAEDGSQVGTGFYSQTAGATQATLLASAQRRLAKGLDLTAEQVQAMAASRPAAAMPGYGTVTNNNTVNNVRNYYINATSGAAQQTAAAIRQELRTYDYLSNG